MEELSVSRADIEKENSIILNLVCEISPKSDESGQILEYSFQEEDARKIGKSFNEYGKGSFCSFSIPKEYLDKSGVYFIFENDSLQYIGECKNLSNRFNSGYGMIKFRNCMKDGQHTNCRLNNKILEIIKNQNKIFLYFFETNERKNLEKKLISQYHPQWNKTQTNRTKSKISTKSKIQTRNNKAEKMIPQGKYEKLYNYLQSCENKEIYMNFTEIETLLGFSLPPSAYKYRAWWANDSSSHSHARAWLNAGRRVLWVNLGESVKFSINSKKSNI